MIEVEELCRWYGPQLAVDHLSFSVGNGEVVGFLGPNGAGKSTTLRILTGFLGPSSGRVRVDGLDVVKRPLKVRQRLGYMPEASPSYPELRVTEYLQMRAQLKQLSRHERRSHIARSMEMAGILERRDAIIGHLSKGYRQRLGLADALLARPPLLILDEPTSGLDPNQIREVRTVIRGLGEQHTVLLSTHILSEVEATCHRAVVIHRGRRVAEGSLEELQGRRKATRGRLTVDGQHMQPPQSLLAHATLLESETATSTTSWNVKLKEPDRGMATVVEAAVREGLAVIKAELVQPSLEEVFASLTDDAQELADGDTQVT